jgi:hypothetical protein
MDWDYQVIRYYKNTYKSRVIISRCTLAEAQLHCSNPNTSSSTCTTSAGKARTRKMGEWFDGYERRLK